MTAIGRIKAYLAHIPEGQSFPSTALRPLAATDNIRQILKRLVKTGQIKRVARGVYIKSKHIASLGEISPSITEVAQTVANLTGETIGIHGAESARQLQLTTQVPMQLVFYTNGNTRTLKIANRTVKLKHVNPSRLIAAGTVPGLILSALAYLGKENVTLETLHTIKQRISSEEFQATLKFMEHMPAWMADMFYRYQYRKKKSLTFNEAKLLKELTPKKSHADEI